MSMFKGIGDLIVLLSGTYYPNTVIYKNFYNNTTLPTNNNFVVMNELSSTPLTSLVSSTWTVDEMTNENTEVINQLVETWFQIDFYGEQANIGASALATAMQSRIGNEFLTSYGYTVKSAESPRNLTFNMDRSEYIKRYCVKFSLFNNVIISNTIQSFNETTLNPLLAEVQT